MKGISVVIPVFNGAGFVEKAITSALEQGPWVSEIVVVDDGSTDNTREVVTRFKEPVRYIYQANKGLSGARNTGIRAAQSDWVALLDCDDWFLPGKLEKQCRALEEKKGAILSYTSTVMALPSGEQPINWATPDDELWPRLRIMNLITPSTVVVKREAALAVGGFNEAMRACEDWEMWVRLRPYGSFVRVREPLIVYRVVPESLSANPERMLQYFEQMLEPTLLADLSGPMRAIWRRRSRATQLFSAALIARAAGNKEKEKSLVFRSLAEWPSPFFNPKRFAAAALALKNSSGTAKN